MKETDEKSTTECRSLLFVKYQKKFNLNYLLRITCGLNTLVSELQSTVKLSGKYIHDVF